jgi:hypothetical protein
VKVFDTEMWATRLAIAVAIEKREIFQNHGVKTVAVFSNSQAAIRPTAHLAPGPGQRLARWMNRMAQSLLSNSLAIVIHWVLGTLRRHRK